MKRAKVVTIALAILAIIAVIVAAGVIPRLGRSHALAAETKALASDIPLVDVTSVKAPADASDLQLPGSMQAIQEAPIYARASGYIKQSNVDIGDIVKSGTVLAVIEAPEVDQELAQANANVAHALAAVKQSIAGLEQAKTRLELAKITAERYQQLTGRGAVSKQDNDEKQNAFEAAKADVDAGEANVRASNADVLAQRANVRRVEEMQRFLRVAAPFDGVVTARNYDAGALISSGTSADQKELFRMAKTDSLRVFVSIPQPAAPYIRAGQHAVVTVKEFAGREFTGLIARTAGAIDPNTRTLLTEVHIPNASHQLLPGMFASVKFAIPRGAKPLVVPGAAVTFGAAGPRVAVVSNDGTLHFVSVRLGNDLGATLEVVSGLKPGARVVLNPSDDLHDGEKVQVTGGKG